MAPAISLCHYLQLRAPRPPCAMSTVTAGRRHWGQNCQHLSSQISLLKQVGQGRLLGRGASVPGHGLSTQSCPKVYGLRGVLTKPGVGSELQDLLILGGEKALRGCQIPACQPPTLPSLDPMVRMGGIQEGRKLITHFPGSSVLSEQWWGRRVVGQWGAGPGTHVNSLSQKLLQHLTAQQPQFHGGLEEKALPQPDWPTSALHAEGLAQRGLAT